MKLLSAQITDKFSWRVALFSPYLFGIVFCEIASLLLWLRVLSVMPVGRAQPISSIAYLLVLALGWFGFHEAMHPAQFIGSALILGGVWVLSVPSSQPEMAPL